MKSIAGILISLVILCSACSSTNIMVPRPSGGRPEPVSEPQISVSQPPAIYLPSGKSPSNVPVEKIVISEEQSHDAPSQNTPLENAPAHEPSTVTETKGPEITSTVSHHSKHGNFTITIKGYRFFKKSKVQIYDVNDHYLSSCSQHYTSNPPSKLVIIKKLNSGREYHLRVKNPDGRISNMARVIIKGVESPGQPPKPIKPQDQASISAKPHVLYLGGGQAEEIFSKYIASNHTFGDSCPRDIRIKFWENGHLQVVSLNDMEQLFVESSNDFVNKLKKRLKGHSAQWLATIVESARNEKADYYIIPK